MRLINKLITAVAIFTLLAPFVLFLFNISIICREPLLSTKASIEEGLSDLTGRKVVIDGMECSPLLGFIFTDIKVYGYDGTLACRVKKVYAGFRLLSYIIHREFSITSLCFYKPVLFNLSECMAFMPDGDGARSGAGPLKISPGLVLRFNDGILTEKASAYGLSQSKIGFDLSLVLRANNKIHSSGILDFGEYDFKGYPLSSRLFPGEAKRLKYNLAISQTDANLFIEKMHLGFGHFKLDVTGNIIGYKTGPTANLNLTLKDMLFPKAIPVGENLSVKSIDNLTLHMKASEEEILWSLKAASLMFHIKNMPIVLDIGNLSCQIYQTQQGTVLKDARCFLGDIPIGAKAEISYPQGPRLEFSIVSYPGQIASLRSSNPLNFIIRFSGKASTDKISGSLSLAMDRLLDGASGRRQQLDLNIDDLIYLMPDHMRADAEKAHGTVLTSGRLSYSGNLPWQQTRLDLTDSELLLYTDKDQLRLDKIRLSAYNGSINGKGCVNFSEGKRRYTFDLLLDSIDTGSLKETIPLDFEITGDLSGDISFDNETIPSLEAGLLISNGRLQNLALLNSVADFLGVDSIKGVDFAAVSSKLLHFKAGNELFLKDLKLESRKMEVKASIKIDDARKVNGELLMRLPADVLKESSSMRYILSLARERLPYADFEFIITGDTRYPRIRWLDSRFKELLLSVLSESDKEAIEAEIEKIIAGEPGMPKQK